MPQFQSFWRCLGSEVQTVQGYFPGVLRVPGLQGVLGLGPTFLHATHRQLSSL